MPTFVSLTILYQSRMRCLPPRWMGFTNGTHQDRDSDYSRAERYYRNDEVDQGLQRKYCRSRPRAGGPVEVVEFPAIFPDTDNVLWPEFWSRDELEGVRQVFLLVSGMRNTSKTRQPRKVQSSKGSGGMFGKLMIRRRVNTLFRATTRLYKKRKSRL